MRSNLLSTERQPAEQELAETKNLYQSLVDELPHFLYRIDLDGKLTFVNKMLQQSLQTPLENIIGKTAYDFYPKELAEKYRRDDEWIIQNGISQTIVEDNISPITGQRSIVEVTKIPIFGAGGNIVGIQGLFIDITERKQAEERMTEGEERFRQLAAAAFEGIAVTENGFVVDGNAQLLQMLGYDYSEIIGKPVSDFIAPESRAVVSAKIGANSEQAYDHYMLRKDGTIFPVESRAKMMTWKGKPMRVTALMEISERIRTEEALKESESRFRGMFEQAALGVAQIETASGKFVRINQAYCDIVGYSRAELESMDFLVITHAEDLQMDLDHMESLKSGAISQFTMEKRYLTKSGDEVWVSLTVSPMWAPGEAPNYHLAIVQDITLNKMAASSIARMAYFDHLTNLPNRRNFLDRLKQALASSERNHRRGALLFIDLDNFKKLNDTLGHEMGDLLLQQVGERLSGRVRATDMVARLGGDEFVVLLADLADEDFAAAAQAQVAGEKILTILNQLYELGNYKYHTTPSIGAVLFSGHEQSPTELLRQADIAMYQAKASGKNAFHFFDDKMQANITARAVLNKELHLALAENQFELYYQPQICNEQVSGAEVLIRWRHPQRGLIHPEEFISIAEETSLILLIGNWVLETACAQLKIWALSESTRKLELAVNVSARQFHHPDFVAHVLRSISSHDIDPHLLKLELTESLVLDNITDARDKMTTLRKAGVEFALDDFGTGHSSLSHLRKLPIAQLKIDKSFVQDLTDDPDDAIIVQTIIAMGKKLGLHIIAEGVETRAQRGFLEKNDCHCFQGYLFGRPVPLQEFKIKI